MTLIDHLEKMFIDLLILYNCSINEHYIIVITYYIMYTYIYNIIYYAL